MMLNRQEAEQLFKNAVFKLQSGRLSEARVQAELLTTAGYSNSQAFLLMATICRAQNDSSAEEAALDRLLAKDSRSVRGLIMKGDCRARAGDEDSAVSFYRAALQVGSGQDQSLLVLEELRRARAAVEQFKTRYVERLESSLIAKGLTPEQRSPRFRQSLELISGRKQTYFQQPTGYFFPELPQTQFYDRKVFDWAQALEAVTDTIRGEIIAYMTAGPENFRPYIQSDQNLPRLDENPLLDSMNWSALFLCENSKVSEEVIARFPETWAAVQNAPLPWIDRCGPTVMFSLLRAGAWIRPHTGMFNTRLICHLPLIVPENCSFRVGNEVRQWEEGRLIIFDDTIEHEAWNQSSKDRVVLIFDIWRPELTEQERREVGTLLSTR
jgi:aspartyl/asparaginyl beta-hydroxylase (cupin superfamily)